MKQPHSLSRPLRRRSRDLQRLINEGYCLTFRDAPDWLVPVMDWLKSNINPMHWHEPSEWISVLGIPYVTACSSQAPGVARGDLAIPLWIENGASVRPKEHWALWHGSIPCFAAGQQRWEILAPGVAPHQGVMVLSQKLQDGLYIDHHDKIETYLSFIVPQAQKLNPKISARC